MPRLLAGLFLSLWAAAGAQPVLQGTVTDAETGATLVGATVWAPALDRGAVTNAYGHYRLALPADSVALVVSSVGYARLAVSSADALDGWLHVALAPAVLDEVVVEAGADRPERTPQMGQTALTGRDIRALPALAGEADVLKAIQLLPGVRAGQEGTAGLHVRGGSPDQTLILLDGVPVYNASHLFGFISTFDGQAVDRATLSRGAGARWGGRLAGVLDVRTREGDLERRRVQARVGVLATQVLAEGPIVPGKASVLVSARRTHVDLLARPFVARYNQDAAARNDVQITPSVSFFDLTAKASWTVSPRDRLYLSAYGGGDAFSFQAIDPEVACDGGACAATGVETETGGTLDWGNRTAALRWTRVVSPRVFSALTLTASDYGFDVGVVSDEGRGGPNQATAAARYRSGIRDWGARWDLDVAAGAHTVTAGASLTHHRFTPGALLLEGDSAADGVPSDTTLGSGATTALDGTLYVQDTWQRGPLTLDLGVHAALYATARHRYPSVEPRLSASLRVRPRLAVKASASTAQQPIHLLTTGAGIGLPADLWVPADSVGPERGRQWAVGLAGSSASGRTTWTLEGYARTMTGLVAYRDGAAFTTPTADWQDLVVTGDGRSRGLEALVTHRTPRWTGWLAYTLARTERRFNSVADGAWFPYRYDRRHDLSAVAQVRLGRFDVSAAFAYGTGDAVTLPAATYDATYLAPFSTRYWSSTSSAAVAEVAFGPRNGHRLPAYVRLDLGATLFFRRGAHPHALALHVYNATNRKNPFVTLLDDRTDPDSGETRQQLVGIALFPVLPTLSYQVSL